MRKKEKLNLKPIYHFDCWEMCACIALLVAQACFIRGIFFLNIGTKIYASIMVQNLLISKIY